MCGGLTGQAPAGHDDVRVALETPASLARRGRAEHLATSPGICVAACVPLDTALAATPTDGRHLAVAYVGLPAKAA